MDNLATSAVPIESADSDNKVSVNAAFYRKLTQQIVQKDNIIKLLRLQVEDLNSRAGEGGGTSSYASDEENEQLQARIDELTTELNAERSRLRKLLREEGFSKEERQELDEQLEAYRQEIGSYSSATQALEDKIEELVHERDDLSLRLVNLSDDYAELSSREVISPEDMEQVTNELSAAKAGILELEAENKRLHKRLQEARQEASDSSQAIENLQEKLAEAHRKLDSLPHIEKIEEENTLLDETCRELDTENESLKLKLKDALEALSRNRKESQSRFSASDWRILSGVVEMYDAIVGSTDSLPDPELEEMAFSVFDALKIEKIETTGRFLNSEFHNVVETVYTADYEHNLVIGEKNAGYMASGAVIRNADVVVANNPYWCSACCKAATEGSSFCNRCGEPLKKVEVRPDNFEGREHELVALGNVREKSLDLDGALERYRQALEVDGCNREALRGVARIEELKGNFTAALDAYATLEENSPLKPAESRGRRRVELKLEINRMVKDIF